MGFDAEELLRQKVLAGGQRQSKEARRQMQGKFEAGGKFYRSEFTRAGGGVLDQLRAERGGIAESQGQGWSQGSGVVRWDWRRGVRTWERSAAASSPSPSSHST